MPIGSAPAIVWMSVASPCRVMRTRSMAPATAFMPLLDLVALEGGAGGAAGDRHAAVVGQRDLGVGADVDGHARTLLAGQPRGGDDGQRIRADEAGDRRREVHAAVRVHVEAELTRAQRERLGRGRRERRLPEADRRQAERQMMHGGVADDGHVADVVGVDALALVEQLQVGVDAFAHGLGEGGRVVVLDGLRDARDDVLAVAHLRVLDRLLVDEGAAREVEQVDDDLGGADVDGDAVELRRGSSAACTSTTRLPYSVATTRQRPSRSVLGRHVEDLERHLDAAEGLVEALQVGARVVERRRRPARPTASSPPGARRRDAAWTW